VSTFLEAAPELISDYRFAVSSGDQPKAVHASHTLKGSSRSIGANVFAVVCEEAEKAARAGDLEKCRTILPDIEHAFDVLVDAGQAFLAHAA
jgi:HPt (histidine-containing phosphotransfer) domain-containing protein